MIILKNERNELFQWDMGQSIVLLNEILPTEVHFQNINSTHALVVELIDNEAPIPNILLQEPFPIEIYLFYKNNNESHTIKRKTLTVIPRAQPTDYVYTETEVFKYETVLATAQRAAEDAADAKADAATAVADASSAAQVAQGVRDDADAGVFKGDKGDKGEPGEKGDKGEQGIQGEPGSDAEVTTENIEAALGYAPRTVPWYQGVDLTAKFAAEISEYSDEWAWIKARIQAVNFSGIHAGDYIPFTTSNGVTMEACVAGIDTYYNYGDTAVGHHIDFISRELWPERHAMNKANYNNGISTQTAPWLASDLYCFLNSLAAEVPNAATVNPELTAVDYTTSGVYDKLPSALKAVIAEKRIRLNRRYSAFSILGADNDNGWENLGKLWLPNEAEVYGMPVWSGTGYSNEVAVQYPVFAGNMNRAKRLNGIRCGWWLLSPYNGNGLMWCNVGYSCDARGTIAGNTDFGTPVCFRIA